MPPWPSVPGLAGGVPGSVSVRVVVEVHVQRREGTPDVLHPEPQADVRHARVRLGRVLHQRVRPGVEVVRDRPAALGDVGPAALLLRHRRHVGRVHLGQHAGVGAGEAEHDLAVRLEDLQVGGPRAAYRADLEVRRVVEDRHVAGVAALDQLLDHDRRLAQALLQRPRALGVVDLDHDDRALGLDRAAGERVQAASAWPWSAAGRRGMADGGCSRLRRGGRDAPRWGSARRWASSSEPVSPCAIRGRRQLPPRQLRTAPSRGGYGTDGQHSRATPHDRRTGRRTGQTPRPYVGQREVTGSRRAKGARSSAREVSSISKYAGCRSPACQVQPPHETPPAQGQRVIDRTVGDVAGQPDPRRRGGQLTEQRD